MPTATVSDVVETLDAIQSAKPRVLVWGDECIDLYRFCDRREDGRLNERDQQQYRGMAGGVSVALQAIGVRIKSITADLAFHERIVVDGKVVEWIEQSYRPYEKSWEVLAELPTWRPQAIVVSDYGRGACTVDGLRTVIDAANAANIPCIIDPHRQRDLTRYHGASVIKCNREHHAPGLVMPGTTFIYTNGDRGLWLEGYPSRASQHFPTEPIDPAFDCGAGDVVLAALGCAVAAGVDLARACRFANAVAGAKCRKLGPLSMTPGELRAAMG